VAAARQASTKVAIRDIGPPGSTFPSPRILALVARFGNPTEARAASGLSVMRVGGLVVVPELKSQHPRRSRGWSRESGVGRVTDLGAQGGSES
jgi:hypothetical protein